MVVEPANHGANQKCLFDLVHGKKFGTIKVFGI